tara:strand:+ start:265 stop:498 length:234 start_codon:yes stop_codon:yes gene_type:complete
MENIYVEDVKEIIKVLRDNNKKDLVTKIQIHFEELLDDDYNPPVIVKREKYSDTEGSADEEEEYCFQTDEHGLLSLV